MEPRLAVGCKSGLHPFVSQPHPAFTDLFPFPSPSRSRFYQPPHLTVQLRRLSKYSGSEGSVVFLEAITDRWVVATKEKRRRSSSNKIARQPASLLVAMTLLIINTRVYSLACVKEFTLFTRVCLPMFTLVYLLLHFFTYVYPCLLVFTYVHSRFPMFTRVYLCVLVLTLWRMGLIIK